MRFAVHGIGFMTYGQRDYWPDGSFVTTEWFVLGWMPLIPVGSKRVSFTRNSDCATYDANGRFFVYEELPVDRRQAAYTYLWLIGVFGPIILFSAFQEPLTNRYEDTDWIAAVAVAVSAVTFVMPYLLRQWVKRQNAKRWRREALGLHG